MITKSVLLTALVLAVAAVAGCGGGDGHLPSYGSAQAVVDAMNEGGVTCADARTTEPDVFGTEGASELVRCAPAAGELPTISTYFWPDGADAGAIEDFHRATHCDRIDAIDYVIGADWSVLLGIAVRDGVGSQDLDLARDIAEATGGEVSSIGC